MASGLSPSPTRHSIPEPESPPPPPEHPEPPPAAPQFTPRWALPLRNDAPQARFIDRPNFPADRELGYPHIIDTRSFTEATDLRSFRACDAIATFLYKYNRFFCKQFFDDENTDISFMITDRRVHQEGTPTWRIDKLENTVKIEIQPARRSMAYSGLFTGFDMWTPSQVKDVEDEFPRELNHEDMEMCGSYIGRRLLMAQLYHPTPYFSYRLEIEGVKVHPEWPGENLGGALRMMKLGLLYTDQTVHLGAVREAVVTKHGGFCLSTSP
ncbi:hypothetical protein B0T16DRAFT_386385 [Cercophora newfieldiana]|uniref:Uncharacterized protein n=1 Tax=Cercophora newfieldiana TaxID=92897 RepID=A0AA39YTZ9_9PEZI|nr:hypothetical protein B0T16DRAFT_386385 [Cercophora newfieldiana]